MFIRDRGYRRGVELGPYPLEALPRAQTNPSANPPTDARVAHGRSILARIAQSYQGRFATCSNDAPAERGDVPMDVLVRAREIKGAAYYLDASHVGICQAQAGHAEPVAVVIWVAYGCEIEADNTASVWLADAEHDIAHMRATEIGVCIMGHIRALGFAATLHCHSSDNLNLDQLALDAGLGTWQDHRVQSPFLGCRYAAVAVTTDYDLALDQPLDPDARVPALRHWWGIAGATSGREHRRRAARPSHLSRYAMEQVPTVAHPTTLIFADEVPRVPKRAEFFTRSRHGDLGGKAQTEVQRFAFKHPLTDGMMKPLRAMVPFQDGPTAASKSDGFDDAAANTKAIKSLSYHLGADLTGICEIPEYAWYSHNAKGEVIAPRHKYAIVMLIDQGYDTMEGASGDDWISGCQSMRGYIRGAEIAGVMAEFIRTQGYAARAQTNADSEVLQIPLVLWAGLGEMSRIGELVLNPFVGPRFKSVVITTNLELAIDQPVDFGLQEFCNHCKKCARECPVSAIPFGDKVMFNGYEIWKPDVERCTRYRVTNAKGSACGRCMKTCPLNKVVSADGALTHRIGNWLGLHARWLKPLLVPIVVRLDDLLGYGTRNPTKRWWLDLEIINGKAKIPKATNERDIDPSADVSGTRAPIGYYNAADNPAGNIDTVVPVNHKAAVSRAALLESPADALSRRANKGATPIHYIPVTAIDGDDQ